MVAEIQIHQQTNCLRRDMQKALMALPSSPKSRIIRADNQFNAYVSNFIHDQKIKNKKNLCIVLKKEVTSFSE